MSVGIVVVFTSREGSRSLPWDMVDEDPIFDDRNLLVQQTFYFHLSFVFKSS